MKVSPSDFIGIFWETAPSCCGKPEFATASFCYQCINVVAVCKDSYVVYVCGFDPVGKLE